MRCIAFWLRSNSCIPCVPLSAASCSSSLVPPGLSTKLARTIAVGSALHMIFHYTKGSLRVSPSFSANFLHAFPYITFAFSRGFPVVPDKCRFGILCHSPVRCLTLVLVSYAATVKRTGGPGTHTASKVYQSEIVRKLKKLNGDKQEKMREQRGRLRVQPLGYVMSTKVIFRRAEVFVVAAVCLP